MYIVPRGSDSIREWGWRLDLLTTLTHDSWLHLISAPSPLSTLHKSLQHTLSLYIRLCLYQSFLSNGSLQWKFLNFRAHFVVRWLSTAPTKSSVYKLPYNSLWILALVFLLITSRHGGWEHTVHCYTPIVSVEHLCLRRRYAVRAAYTFLLSICCLAADVVSLFASKSLPSNGTTRYKCICSFTPNL
jgi:hypothetical protein